MQREQIQDFTRRIAQGNRSGLTLVTYDIFFAYLADAREAYGKEDWDSYKQALRKAQKAISELIGTLNFSYHLAGGLYQIYIYCRELLAVSLYKRSAAGIDEADKLMRKLYIGFEKAAETDNSGPLMKNTERVYAGYTYGREDVVENCPDIGRSRGFLV